MSKCGNIEAQSTVDKKSANQKIDNQYPVTAYFTLQVDLLISSKIIALSFQNIE